MKPLLRAWLAVLLFAAPLPSWAQDEHPWAEAESRTAGWQIERLGFDAALVARVDAEVGSLSSPLRLPDDEEPVGLAWTVTATQADRIVEALRPELNAAGYRIFVANRNFGTAPDRIALVQTRDPVGGILARGTSDRERKLTTKAIADAIRSWARFAAFDLLAAGPDFVELQFRTDPADLPALLAAVRELAPKSIDGEGAAVKAQLRRSRKLSLWW